ncbi:uncharacterized protein EV422DRAFT_501687, partial [Fimicolochytrium jonesii]|uniref:uncharacterized protein n=1 Tax=Fimicolochytrium jonesii TaxID=1396493 RepID=UPI0022FEB7D8
KNRPDRQRFSTVRTTVLDETSRRRAQQKHIEELQQDNFVDDGSPSYYVAHHEAAARLGTLDNRKKRVQGDEDLIASGVGQAPRKKQKRGGVRALLQKKNFATLLMDSGIEAIPPPIPTYLTVSAKPSVKPPRKFCSVCGYFSKYTCMRCGMQYCSITCRDAHTETR